jgi:hypothetical protein
VASATGTTGCGEVAADLSQRQEEQYELAGSSSEGSYPGLVAAEVLERPIAGTGPEVLLFQMGLPRSAALDSDRSLVPIEGTYGIGGRTGRFKYLVRPETVAASAQDASSLDGEAFAPDPEKLDEEVGRWLRGAGDETLPVIIRLSEEFVSSLSVELSTEERSRFGGVERQAEVHAAKERTFEVRQAEAMQRQAPFRAWLSERGAESIDGFWLANMVSLRATRSLVAALVEHKLVRSVSFDAPLSLTWTGEEQRAQAAVNTAMYIAQGHDGSQPNALNGTSRLRLAVLDHEFTTGHRLFRDGSGTASRVIETWKCSNNPCTSGIDTPPAATWHHGTTCASAAAADAMDNQLIVPAGTPDPGLYRRQRTAPAEEAHLIFITTGAISDTIRGLQRAVLSKADVVSESFGGVATSIPSMQPWFDAVHAAETAGVLVVGSAGNDGTSSSWNLVAPALAPQMLTVGGLSAPATAAGYSGASIWSGSSTGGLPIKVNGLTYSGAVTGVDVVVPTLWSFAADSGSGFVSVAGTSHAAPKVAGAALLFKSWALANGFTFTAHHPGVMRANMLAMTDRANGTSTYRTSGCDKRWGCGRFQMRNYGPEDHPSGIWRWESAAYTLSHGQTVQHLVGGSGLEPTGASMLKAYAVVRETNLGHAADIDLRIYDKNCGSGRALLAADTSKDTKMMAQTTAAGGKAACIELSAAHVPGGGTREVILVVYYSNETVMR